MFPSLQKSLKQVLFVVQILGVCLLGLLFISRKNENIFFVATSFILSLLIFIYIYLLGRWKIKR